MFYVSLPKEINLLLFNIFFIGLIPFYTILFQECTVLFSINIVQVRRRQHTGVIGLTGVKLLLIEDYFRWCSSPEGERIYGKELFNEEESQMTCACSLKKWELHQEKVSQVLTS